MCSLGSVFCNIVHGHLKCLKNVRQLFFFNSPYREVLIFNFSFENYDHLYVSVHVFLSLPAFTLVSFRVPRCVWLFVWLVSCF